MNLRHYATLISTLPLFACAASTGESELDTTTQPIMGSVTYGTDCNATDKAFLDRATFFMRTAAESHHFEQCVQVRGRREKPYMGCIGDPFQGTSIDTQLDRAIAAARSVNGVGMNCTGGSGNASTGIGTYNQNANETLAFGPWLRSVSGIVSPTVWPHSQGAAIIMHEALHTRGYGHGDNSDNNAARTNCGIPAGASFHFQDNTIPYLLENCLADTLEKGDSVCGGASGCGAGFLRLPTGLGAATCECVRDPQLGSETREKNAFRHIVSAGNVNGSMTTLDHPALNGHADAVVHFTHVWNPAGDSGPYNGYQTYAFYNYSIGRWVLANPGGAQMLLGTGFNVRVGRGFVHRSGPGNISNHLSRIDNRLINADPTARITISAQPYAGAYSGVVNPAPVGLYYESGTKRWTLYNETFQTFPSDTAYVIEAENQANHGLFLSHIATPQNTAGNTTYIDSPLTNDRPDAMILVTPNWSLAQTYNPAHVGVYYDVWRGRWGIYNERERGTGGAMPLSAGFNVEVLRDEIVTRSKANTFFVPTIVNQDLQAGDRIRFRAMNQVRVLSTGRFTGPDGDPNAPLRDGFALGALTATVGSQRVLVGSASEFSGLQGYPVLMVNASPEVASPSTFFDVEMRVLR